MKITTSKAYTHKLEHDGSTILIIPIQNKDIDTLQNLLSKEGYKTIEIKQKRNTRSLSANAYSWQLITKLAKMMNIPKGDMYIKMIKRYGQCSQLSVSREAVEETIKYWDSSNTDVEHTENMCEVIGSHRSNNKQYAELNCYYGTSNSEVYDSKTFSQYLNGIVSECQLVGIETKEDMEINAMMESYKEG